MDNALICTLYYGNQNYGGILQAYALCEVLHSYKINALQASYQPYEVPPDFNNQLIKLQKRIKFYGPKYLYDWPHLKFKTFIQRFLFKQIAKVSLEERYENFEIFRAVVPATNEQFNPLCLPSSKYKFYIVGSDQVWNHDMLLQNKDINPGFWLTFTNSKNKIVYAASPPISGYGEKQEEQIIDALRSFKAVSVREKAGIQALVDLYERHNKDIASEQWYKTLQVTVDPVLLLQRQQWEEVSSSNIVLPKKYAFTYILGKDKKFRKKVKAFCKENNLTLVNIPYANNKFQMCDYKYADLDFADAGPREFLSLIKNAEYVFTDSFHASVFSAVFHKKLIVTERNDGDIYSVGSRISDFVDTYGFKDSYFLEFEIGKDFSERVLSAKFDFVESDKRIVEERKKSMDFLKNALDIVD